MPPLARMVGTPTLGSILAQARLPHAIYVTTGEVMDRAGALAMFGRPQEVLNQEIILGFILAAATARS